MELIDNRSDWELLQDYLTHGSEAAFATLVKRHLSLVYAVAYRHCADQGVAEEVANTVFLRLAQKARGLKPQVALAGWLFTAARYVAANTRAFESRRQKWAHEAATGGFLNSGAAPDTEASRAWEVVSDELDRALSELSAQDRDAILLRYYQDKSLREIGTELGISEEAARKRTSRAMEKLRDMLVCRGATWPVATIAFAISTYAQQPAPTSTAEVVAQYVAQHTQANRLSRGGYERVLIWATPFAIALLVVVVALRFGIFKRTASLEPRDIFYLQSGAVLQGDGEAYVRTLNLRTPEERAAALVLSESVRVRSRLRSTLEQRFGTNAFLGSQFPALLDLFDTNQIARATQSFEVERATLTLPWGSRLPFVRAEGEWKLDFFQLPGMPAPSVYTALVDRRNALMNRFGEEVVAGSLPNLEAAYNSFRASLTAVRP